MIISITKSCSFTQLGKRESQEDCFCPINADEQTSFFVVCDGVGGRAHGEIASQLVCQAVEQYLSDVNCEELRAEDILPLVEYTFYTLYNNRAICPTMATTLALMVNTNDGMLLAHLGDSRIYQIRKGVGVVFQTKDHSLVNELLDEGKITPAEAVRHPKRNVITKCIFVTNDSTEYQTPSITLIRDVHPHDVFMLCTDGVYNQANEADIVEILTSDISLEEKTKELAMVCKDSTDNNTAYLVEVVSVDGTDGEKNNVSYTIRQHMKQSLCTRLGNFVRETSDFVKELLGLE